jgi:prolipoprotein diacylglyceryltransferase
VPLAVITFRFDPVAHQGGLAIRWQTLGLVGSILLALLVAAWFARRSGRRTGLEPLRLDDLLYLTVAAIPGAVILGRLAYGLDYVDYYRSHPGAFLDPSQGGLSLLGAVVGGTITAAYMAALLETPVRRWADVASTALLVAIGLGELSLVLGGAGQGLPWTGSVATRYAGPGPWISLAPGVPSYPSQAMQGTWALAGILFVFVLHAGPILRHLPGAVRQSGAWADALEEQGEPVARGRLRFGYLYLAALAWWLAGRIAVGFTWRDPATVGPLNTEQVMAIVVLAVVLLMVIVEDGQYLGSWGDGRYLRREATGAAVR